MPRTRSGYAMGVSGILFGALAVAAGAQSPAAQQIHADDGALQLVPTKNVDFKAVEMDPNFELPSGTIEHAHCLSDGSLVLRNFDWEAIKATPKGKFPRYNEVVTVVQGKKTKTILATSITGVTDFETTDVFPADTGIYFLFWGTEEQPGQRGPGKSPTGQPLASYRSLVGRFDLDGTYKGAIELAAGCDLTQSSRCELRHLAVFPSGDMLVSESDRETSSLRVLYLKSSGEVVKQIEVPASRRFVDWDASSNPQTRQEVKTFISSVYFTAVGDNIVVWRADSNDPVVEVRQGGGVREVPIQTPDGWRLADMVASNDRWVVHFRSENTPPNMPMNDEIDAYYEVRPQDGSLSAKLVQKGEAPRSIACESSGTYTSYKMNDAGKWLLLKGE